MDPEYDEENNEPLPESPPSLKKPTDWVFGCVGLMYMLNLAAIVVSIMAIVPKKLDEGGYLSVSLPRGGRHVQNTEIALAALGFFVLPAMINAHLETIGALKDQFTHLNAMPARHWILTRHLPFLFAGVSLWVIMAALSAAYVPVVGRNVPEECVKDAGLAQCQTINGMFFIAIFASALYFTAVIADLVILQRLKHPEIGEFAPRAPPGEVEIPTRIAIPPRDPSPPTVVLINDAGIPNKPISRRSSTDSPSDIIVGGPSKIE